MALKLVGIDEAGRGPVVGPMVICGVMSNEKTRPLLGKWGVKDSKKLSLKKREYLFQRITEAYPCYIIKVSPGELDRENLTSLEARKVLEIIRHFSPHRVYIDNLGRERGIFSRLIQAGVEETCQLIMKNKLDEKEFLVGAASIVAKVTRDKEIENLKVEYGDFGSGYPSDGKTRLFLRDWYRKHGCFPSIVRKRWRTLVKIQEEGEIFTSLF